MNSVHAQRIAIVGGGIGGLACARTLQRHGIEVIVFEGEASADIRWQGGMLDLHEPTGQAALKTAGLFNEFRTLARTDAQDLRIVDAITGETIMLEETSEESFDAPEIDRGELRRMLLDSLTPGTVHWARRVQRVDAVGDGGARVQLDDGTAEEFALVIGADGAWSRTRRALSNAEPDYLGTTFIGNVLNDVDEHHPAAARLVGTGSFRALDGRTMLLAMRNAHGQITVFVSLDILADWNVSAGIDMDDTAAVRAYLLSALAGWDEGLLELIRGSDGQYANWPLYVLPVGHSWEHVPGITLLGDAAHLMPPYGIGANLALLDGADLAEAIATHDDLDEGVRAYEAIMLPRGEAGARACAEIGNELATDLAVHGAEGREDLNNRILSARDA